MKKSILFAMIVLLASCTATKKTSETKVLSPKEEIKAFQDELQSFYRNKETSPYRDKVADFKGHDFFPVDLNYRVEAIYSEFENEKFFDLPTSNKSIQKKYRKFALLKFKLNGKDHELILYQNATLMNNPMYKDYLFLPFTDLTNNETTYGGGRYIDFRIPKEETTILDFNQAYNPYCAYVTGYSCPIPPEENHLDIEIKAGIMLKGH
jgi:uncharacterized protein (DUF1684 family)